MSFPLAEGQHRLRFYAITALLAALTAVGAFIRIPLPYVPFTLQTFFVMLAGSLLGPVYGSMSQLIYLTVGLIGMPVFANGGGPGYVLQPTFGYLLSYPIAAYIIGLLVWRGHLPARDKAPGVKRIIVACSVGTLVIFTVGVLGLFLNVNFVIGGEMRFATALQTGFLVFLPGSLLKIGVNVVLVRRLTHFAIS